MKILTLVLAVYLCACTTAEVTINQGTDSLIVSAKSTSYEKALSAAADEAKDLCKQEKMDVQWVIDPLFDKYANSKNNPYRKFAKDKTQTYRVSRKFTCQ